MSQSPTATPAPAAPQPVQLKVEADFVTKAQVCQPHTMVDMLRMYALYKGIEHVATHQVPGEMVECGVWRGGCCMLMALVLKDHRQTHRDIWLYDTFTGMTEPGAHDIKFNGESAHAEWTKHQTDAHNNWCFAPLAQVQQNMAATGYDPTRLHFIQGKVEDTIPGQVPARIALLRLDTDWYESTYHELVHLYPKLSLNGIIILDDMYYWKGQGQAAKKYFEEQNVQLDFMHTTTGAIAVKTQKGLSNVERQALSTPVAT